MGELTFDEGVECDGLSVEGCDAVLDEGVSGADQLLHGLGDFAGREAGLEFEGGAHAGQHEGVAAVGFGEFARGLKRSVWPDGD